MSGRHALQLLVTVSFKPNQLRAHLLPIVNLDEVAKVTLVADAPAPPLPKLTTVVPPRWLRLLCGRAAAKFFVCLAIARRERPDWILGYHLLPHGITACVVGKLVDSKSLYHQIGGPLEWLEGGWRSGNAVLGRLPRPSRTLEGFLLRVVRGCSIVAAMGEGGRTALLERGVSARRVVVIPAAVDAERFRPRSGEERAMYDLVTVCDLIELKRIEDLLSAVARLRPLRPALRLAVVGSGPLESELKEYACRLGIDRNVDFLGFRHDVDAVLADAGVFVLPSRYEGLSVALGEAMAAGLPAVVTDVGELRTLVRDGRNGYVVAPGDVDSLVERLARLIDDPAHRRALGRAAAEDARATLSVRRVSALYRSVLTTEVSAGAAATDRAFGHPPEGAMNCSYQSSNVKRLKSGRLKS